MIPAEPRLLEHLAQASQRLETESPLAILEWAFAQYDDVAMACSFEDLALLHMVHEVRPTTPIVFLNTGGHFPETLDFVTRVSRDWALTLVETSAPTGAPVCGEAGCCAARKVEPLREALEGRDAWLTAVKRVDAATRASMPVVSWDEKFSLVKVNPLATWSDDDVSYYLAANDLPTHPLWREGYASIGCAAVTQKPLDAHDRRSGRWAGSTTMECGLHEV
jgi:phosphoadenosine phosphosulfate reductase